MRWSQNPGRIVPYSIIQFHRSTLIPQFLHMWVATFVVTGFLVAGVYAVGMLRGRRDRSHRIGFTVPFAFAAIAVLC